MIVAEVIHADCRLNGAPHFRERSPFAMRQHRIRQYDDRFGIRCKHGCVVEILCGIHIQTAMPQVVIVSTGNKSDLRVVTVVVAEAG